MPRWQTILFVLVAAGMAVTTLAGARAILEGEENFSRRPVTRLLALAAGVDPDLMPGAGICLRPSVLVSHSALTGQDLTITVPRGPPPVLGHVDVVHVTGQHVTVRGWTTSPDPARRIDQVVAAAGEHVLAFAPVNRPRADVAQVLRIEHARFSGFEVSFALPAGVTPCEIKILSLDGALSMRSLPLPPGECGR